MLKNTHISELVWLFSNGSTEENQELVQDRLELFWPLLNGRSVHVVAFACIKFDEHSQSMISSLDLEPASIEIVF
jgi:hypothetical protein